MEFALRTLQTRDPTALLTIWKTIILLNIDYCSQLWANHTNNNNNNNNNNNKNNNNNNNDNNNS